MSGRTGLGKTHLSLSIAKEVMEKGYGVIYGSTPDFLSQIEKERFSRSENDLQTLDRSSRFGSAFSLLRRRKARGRAGSCAV